MVTYSTIERVTSAETILTIRTVSGSASTGR